MIAGDFGARMFFLAKKSERSSFSIPGDEGVLERAASTRKPPRKKGGGEMGSVHPCLRASGKGAGCPECAIMKRGWCEAFVEALKKSGWVRGKLEKADDAEEVAMEAFAAIAGRLDRYESAAHFVNGYKAILKNKVNDRIRSYYDGKDLFLKRNEDNRRRGDEATSETENLEAVLGARNLIGELRRRDPGCFDLLADVCLSNSSREEIAQGMGLKANALNARVKRCRERLLALCAELTGEPVFRTR